MIPNTMTKPTKKPKPAQPDFADAHKACRTTKEREQLAIFLKARWTEEELHEFARLFHFRNGKDYPTAASYRRAIADLVRHYRILGEIYAHPSDRTRLDREHWWLSQFRKGGSKPLPPRRGGLLQRGRGLSSRVSEEEYAWPYHTEEFRSRIEQQARDYFKIAPEHPVHVNAWAASLRADQRQYWKESEVLRKATEATDFILVPKEAPKGAPRRKLVPQHDDSFWGETLKPHFNFEFAGHTAAFREEVAALARKGKKPDAEVSPLSWKLACHKHYVLIEAAAE